MSVDEHEQSPTSKEIKSESEAASEPIVKEIVLKWSTMFCKDCIKPYKGKHDEATRAMLLMAQELMSDRKFYNMCLGDTDNFERIASTCFKPVCCHLGKLIMRYVYAQTGVTP